jgi:hypothetical protein
MKLPDPELDALLAPMRDGPVALSGHGEGASRRQRLLPSVHAAVQGTPQRLRRARMLRRAAYAGSGIAALLVAVTAIGLRAEPAPLASLALGSAAASASLRVEALGSEPVTFVDAAGAARTIAGDAALDGVGELRAPASSWSRVLTARGARIELAPRARLRVARQKAQSGAQGAPDAHDVGLRLEQGEAHLSVPKLAAGDQFSIATPDARVVVHGTIFSVKVDDAAPSRTCVRVNEGLVEVQHRAGSAFLKPGMQWGCGERTETRAEAALAAVVEAPKAIVEADLAATDEAPRARTRIARRHANRARRSAAAAESGTLDRETALLATALAAERDGDRTRASALFSELLLRHPRSPLAPEARSGLARTR